MVKSNTQVLGAAVTWYWVTCQSKSISRLLVNETTPVDYFIHSPQLCAIEGVGGTNAKSTICLCKDPEAMVVGVAQAVCGDGLKVFSVLGDIAVKAPNRVLQVVGAGENSWPYPEAPAQTERQAPSRRGSCHPPSGSPPAGHWCRRRRAGSDAPSRGSSWFADRHWSHPLLPSAGLQEPCE